MLTKERSYTEWDAEHEEMVAITSVISGNVIHDMPTEWIQPDAEGVECASERLKQYRWETLPESEITQSGNDAPNEKPMFPVICGVTVHDHPVFGRALRCAKCNKIVVAWGGFAGDEYDFTIAAMVHWGSHKRDGRSTWR